MLRKMKPACIVCENEDESELKEYAGKIICKDCALELLGDIKKVMEG